MESWMFVIDPEALYEKSKTGYIFMDFSTEGAVWSGSTLFAFPLIILINSIKSKI